MDYVVAATLGLTVFDEVFEDALPGNTLAGRTEDEKSAREKVGDRAITSLHFCDPRLA
jgi:hypothetical protein